MIVEKFVSKKPAYWTILFQQILDHTARNSPEAEAVSEMSLYSKCDVSGGCRTGPVPVLNGMLTASKQSAARIEEWFPLEGPEMWAQYFLVI